MITVVSVYLDILEGTVKPITMTAPQIPVLMVAYVL